MTAVILVGGEGLRLRSVLPPGLPKPMARVAGKPFLEHLLTGLGRRGIHRMVLAVGYGGSQVEAHFGDGSPWGLDLVYSRETASLGTGGAIRLAAAQVPEEPFLVLNGDSIPMIDLRSVLEFHSRRGALATITVVEMADRKRYGSVVLNAGDEVVRFEEKGASGPGLVSAGVYVFSRRALEFIPSGPSSLEEEVFPRLAGYGLLGRVVAGGFVDIGLPEELLQLNEHPERLLSWAMADSMPSGVDP